MRRGLILGALVCTCASAQVSPARLVTAYPAFLARLDGHTLLWRNGPATPLDAGHVFTSPADRLDHPDLRELLRQPYPACMPLNAPAYANDPGRARPAAFFGRMYGSSPATVRANLEPVNWFGQTLMFSRVNGAANALRAVEHDLAAQPALRKYLTPSAGTYLWRVVAGSTRQSAHSWGIAIDINTRYSAYWEWSGYREFQRGIPYSNRLPQAVVWAFERHGFVWGGRWYHSDTMHFEYRPELSGC
ncbi:M15 family metallopeptidase [Deinococcus sp. KNUC1210]|uniref:M15 family metallopeptidase n=1 Tax=Deinococcus sp. KNUC1210 TaxID=2917691 RepID=UPI001EF0CFD4|nr:M15 family metallopeptidase [Deinococcus sp. KNUC1210]ULH15767.1 M15 family metallopeptidase [Deinococcus sp. KNUC1210]